MLTVTFSCDVQVPRAADSVGIPTAWLNDSTVSFEVRGLVFHLLSCLAPGVVMSDVEVDLGRPAYSLPIVAMVQELKAAGYLQRVGADSPDKVHYELVHPNRLPPLPSIGEVASSTSDQIEIKVHFTSEDEAHKQVFDEHGTPMLTFGYYPNLGAGWILWYPESWREAGDPNGTEDQFIGGDKTDVEWALEQARKHLRSLR